MRATLPVVVLVSLVLPLLAQGEDPLADCVKRWHSPDAAAREAASRVADEELRRRLAPLLLGLEDDDPEVRRRTRQALLSLVPHEPEPGPAQAVPPGAVILQAGGGAWGKGLRVQVQPAQAWGQNPPAVIPLKLDPLRALQLNPLQPPQLVELPRQKIERAVREGLGLSLREERRHGGGLSVRSVTDGSAAERLGVARGDVVLEAQGRRVRTFEELGEAFGEKPDWAKVRLKVLRRGQTLELPLVR